MLKKILMNLSLWFSYIALVLIIGLSFINVICRYLFGFYIMQFEEVSLILFVWMCYIGASISYENEGHIAIDAIYGMMPRTVQKIVDVFVDVVGAVTCIYTTYLGCVICANLGVKVTSVLRLPFVVFNGAIVVGFALMSLYGVLKVFERCRALFRQETEEGGNVA